MKEVVLVIALALTGCITPPAIMKAGESRVWLGEFPPGSQLVEIPVDDGERLRGVFVPADDGAPVVLHLLESQGSVTGGTVGIRGYPVLWDLCDRGFSSLAVDYRGVGASDGARSPRHLRDDARAAWSEAVRRAGGDPHRVIIRAMSIGTLAAATLLDGGAEPAAVVLIAPVRGETVATNYAYEMYADVFAFLVTPFLRATVDVDIVSVLAHSKVPLLVESPAKDFLLLPDEMALVESSVRAARGRFVRGDGLDHVALVLEAHRVLDDEASVYATTLGGRPWPPIQPRVAEVLSHLSDADAARFAPGTATRARLESVVASHRLEPPALAAALALATDAGDDERRQGLVDWTRSLPADRLRELPLDVLAALVDLADSSGALDVMELDVLSGFARGAAIASSAPGLPERLAALAVEKRFDRCALVRPRNARGIFRYAIEEIDLDGPLDPAATVPPRLRLARSDALREAVRMLLKGAAIPDRVVASNRIEVWDAGAWRPLEMPGIQAHAGVTSR
ncbi:MAG: alpha/beta hydrolase [Planctomycetes bacterium]|nr:alpha/beta hydrolase [Planctomycetota bacterium]